MTDAHVEALSQQLARLIAERRLLGQSDTHIRSDLFNHEEPRSEWNAVLDSLLAIPTSPLLSRLITHKLENQP